MPAPPRSARSVRLAWLAALACAACSAGADSCSDGASYPSPAPPGGELRPEAVRARVTEHLLTFLETHLGALLGAYFTIDGDRARYFLDEELFGSDALQVRDGCIGADVEPCSSPSYRSSIALDLRSLADNVDLSFLPADDQGRPGVSLSIRELDLFVDVATVLSIDAVGSAACLATDPPGRAAVHLRELGFELRLAIDTSSGAPRLAVAMADTRVDLGATSEASLALAVTPCDGSGTCSDAACGADCADICDLLDLFGEVGGFLDAILQPVLDAMAPALAESLTATLNEALITVPLAFGAEIDLQSLLGGIADRPAALSLAAAASGLAVSGVSPGGGLDFTLEGGLASAQAASCVGDGEPPDLAALQGSPPVLTGFVEVVGADGQPRFERYHAAVTISEAMLAQGLWAAHRAGAMCVRLSAEQVEAMAGGAFPFTAGLLASIDGRIGELTDPQAPLLAVLRPGAPPRLRLGAGGLVATDVSEPLIELTLERLGLDLYVLMDDTQERITSITTDVSVHLEIERTATQALEVTVSRLSFDDVTETYNELVADADFSQLFELVVDLAVTQFLGDNLSFEVDVGASLGATLGVPLTLRVNRIRRDVGPDGARFLSVYSTLCDDADAQNPDDAACYTSGEDGRSANALVGYAIEPSSLYRSADVRHPAPRWWAAPSGRLELRVGGPEAAAREYQARVDGGAWSAFRPAPQGLLALTSPRLAFLGRHTVEVRSRRPGLPTTRDAGARISFWIDPERPALALWPAGDGARAEAADYGSPELVELWARQPPAQEWTPAGTFIPRRPGAERLEVVARDAAGNSSEIATLDWRAAELSTAHEARAGCAAAPEVSWWLVLVVLATRLAAGIGNSGRRRVAVLSRPARRR